MNDNNQVLHEISVADLLDAVQAKEIAPGVTLMTKNGATVGNAIVIEQIGDTRDWYKDGREIVPVWLCETDFGNRMKLTNWEILAWYELGYQRDYDSWCKARMALIQKGIEDGEPAL